MERLRSLSSSSGDSWSLLDEASENKPDLLPTSKDDANLIGQMEPLESISHIILPLEFDPMLAVSSQHLLVVTTPTSSSLVTQSGTILSPEQSALAFSNEPDSPATNSPARSLPIESTFTFLKDPNLRISFSNSSDESNEGGEEKIAEAILRDDVSQNVDLDDEVFASERCKNVAETAEEARKMIDEVEIDAAEEEEEVILQKNIVVETVKEETSEQGSGKNGFAAATREEQKASCSTDQFILHFQEFGICQSVSLDASLVEVGSSATISLPQSLSSSEQENTCALSIISSEKGWTELSMSSSSTEENSLCSSDEEVLKEQIQEIPPEIMKGAGKRADEHHDDSVEKETLWQRILAENFLWLKNFERSDRIINVLIFAMFLTSISSITILHILENTWISGNTSSPQHHHFQLTANRRMRLVSNMRQTLSKSTLPPPNDYYCGLAGCHHSLPQHFTADGEETHLQDGDQRNKDELRQCRNELLEIKNAYQSKAKLLHYVRFKELEQAAMVDVLRNELHEVKSALSKIRAQGMQEPASAMSSQPVPLDLILVKTDELQQTEAAAKISIDEDGNNDVRDFEQFETRVENDYPKLISYAPPSAGMNIKLKAAPVNRRKTYHFYRDQHQGFSGDHSSQKDHSSSIVDVEKPKKSTKTVKANADYGKEQEEASHSGFGRLLLNWRIYNEFLQNLSTISDRIKMMKAVKNAMTARLNRTIEKTSTFWAAASKMVSVEDFGKRFLASTVKEVMKFGSATGLNALMDFGIEQMKNMHMTLKNTDQADEKNRKSNDEAERTKKKMGLEVEEKRAHQKKTSEWFQQRANGRAALRHRTSGNSLLYFNRSENGTIRFAQWLFGRADLRRKKRLLQQNGTIETETRSSLLRDDWFYTRQKIRAKLRQTQHDGRTENNNKVEEVHDWFFARYRFREKARRNRGRQNVEKESEGSNGAHGGKERKKWMKKKPDDGKKGPKRNRAKFNGWETEEVEDPCDDDLF